MSTALYGGAQVSRGPPPPLPGGYTVGEQIYFTGTSQTFERGDRLEHGKQGEVVGPATSESLRGKGVDVRFHGNVGLVSCYPTQVSRRRRRAATPTAPRCPSCPSSQAPNPPTMWRVGAQVSREPPPPLPGGYTAGERIYYTGTSGTVDGGDRVEHGKQGEVVGPATSESFRGKGVDVSFPGNKRVISCWLISVRRRRRRAQPPTAPHRLSCPSPSPANTTSAVWAHR